jgi:DNA-binding MurR/RpiR family transcriptional regulator
MTPSPASLTPENGSGYELTSRIRSTLPHMSASMAKIGQLLLDDPAILLNLTINEVAERAGVSAASVTRFARQIGYSGYLAMRVSAATDLGRANATDVWATAFGEVMAPGDAPPEVLRSLLGDNLRALQTASELLDREALGRVAEAVAVADQVIIFGVGVSSQVGTVAASHLFHIGVNVRAWNDLHTGITAASMLSPRSVAIAVSNSGRTVETVEVQTAARSTGALTVAVTSDPTSPLARGADHLLQTYRAEESLLPSGIAAKYAQMFVLDAVYVMVARLDEARTTERLANATALMAAHRPVVARPRGKAKP